MLNLLGRRGFLFVGAGFSRTILFLIDWRRLGGTEITQIRLQAFVGAAQKRLLIIRMTLIQLTLRLLALVVGNNRCHSVYTVYVCLHIMNIIRGLAVSTS